MILTSRRQQRVLAAMQDSLRESDPRLVARFTVFMQLTGDEAMPGTERLRHRPLRWLVSAVRGMIYRRRLAAYRNRAARASRKDRARWRLGGVLFIPAAAMAMLIVVMLLNQGQGRGTCAAGGTITRARPQVTGMPAATGGSRMFNSVRAGTTPGQQGTTCSGR